MSNEGNKKYLKAIESAEKLCKKLRASPKNDTYENYGQKEKREYLDKIDNTHTKFDCEQVFNKYRF